MTLFVWIVVGLTVGLIASRMVRRRGKGILLDLVLGMFGSLAGGYLFMWLAPERVNGLTVYTVLSSITGAALVLFINYGIRRGFADRLS
jgi:uncharacterized membrane protein YeaQ/YmgE (transglycosylase-associated protein family)